MRVNTETIELSSCLCVCTYSVDSVDHQAALSRSLEDFSAISPAMQRVVRGYHGAQESVVNGVSSVAPPGGGFDCSVFSPHPSPTVESRPHRSSSCDTVVGTFSNGGSHANNPGRASSLTDSHHRGDTVAEQQSVIAGIDRTLAALFAVGIAVVLAIIFILLGQDNNIAATMSDADLEPDLGCAGQC